MCVPSLQEQRQCVGSFEEDTSDNIYATLGEVYIHVTMLLLIVRSIVSSDTVQYNACVITCTN